MAGLWRAGDRGGSNRKPSRFCILLLREPECILLLREPDAEEARKAVGTGEAPMGEVVSMPVRSSLKTGVFFEPEEIAAISQAFEAVCETLQDASGPEVGREVIARRIIAAASTGERDPARLQAAALAGRRAARR